MARGEGEYDLVAKADGIMEARWSGYFGPVYLTRHGSRSFISFSISDFDVEPDHVPTGGWARGAGILCYHPAVIAVSGGQLTLTWPVEQRLIADNLRLPRSAAAATHADCHGGVLFGVSPADQERVTFVEQSGGHLPPLRLIGPLRRKAAR